MALGLTCLITSVTVEETQIWSLSFLLFLLNLFSSIQDIAVDSLAVNILDENELGAGNTIQVVAYKMGSLFAGSLLLFVREAFGWSPMFMAFSSIYFVALGLISFISISEKKSSTISSDNMVKDSNPKDGSISNNLAKIFKVDGTIWMTFFVLVYKLCERSEQTFALYLVDKKVPKTELAMLSTAIRAHSIAGSFASGLVLTAGYVTAKNIVYALAILRTFGISLLTLVTIQWGNEPATFEDNNYDFYFKYTGFFAICLTSVGAGAVTTAVFTIMMQISKKAPDEVQGTHYSMLATCEVLGKLLFAALAGWLIDIFGLQAAFVLFTILAIFVVPVIYLSPIAVGQKVD